MSILTLTGIFIKALRNPEPKIVPASLDMAAINKNENIFAYMRLSLC